MLTLISVIRHLNWQQLYISYFQLLEVESGIQTVAGDSLTPTRSFLSLALTDANMNVLSWKYRKLNRLEGYKPL